MTDPLVRLDRLDVRDGIIHYKLRSQEGGFTPMTARDTLDMRRFVAWVQKHD